MRLLRRVLAASAIAFASTVAQPVHYDVKLRVDLAANQLVGREEIRFAPGSSGLVELQKQAGLSGPDAPAKATSVQIRADRKTRFDYRASPGPGLRWFPDNAGFFTAFHCEAWMICDNAPGHRATLRLEIVLPADSGLTAVGPGHRTRTFRDKEGAHFVYEVSQPAQTYLFSFGAGKLVESRQGRFLIHAAAEGHKDALAKTADAYAFLREKAGVDMRDAAYTQVFLAPARGLGQETAGMALMSEAYLARLETENAVVLMAHELAHQWWGVSVGIRSWSDFWLNEGMAEFVSLAYLEKVSGRAAYETEMAKLKTQMDEIRAKGGDRPLHWEKWKSATEALGPLPYVKGALFLDRLRKALGEETFWRGLREYTTKNAGRLVDSKDFQTAMEQASNRDLASMFDAGVYR